MQSLLDDKVKHVLENIYDGVYQGDTFDDDVLNILVHYGFIHCIVEYDNAPSNHYDDYEITHAGRAYVETWREHRRDIQKADQNAAFSKVMSIISVIISFLALALQVAQYIFR